MAINPLSLLITAAFTAASYFLRPSQNIERGKLNEIPLQMSEYGGMIPKMWGTIRLGGNIVWSTGLRQESETESAKGIGGPKVTTYTYFTDLAVMLCENKIRDVLRIWGDGKIIYDKTGETATPPEMEGLDFRVYYGDDDQEPDALIQSDLDGKYGTGSTPAFRGRAYIVFENLNLTNFGNRIPNLSFEVVADPDDGSDPIGMAVYIGPDQVSLNADAQSFKILDSDRGKLYYMAGGSGTYEVQIIDLDTMNIIDYQYGGDPTGISGGLLVQLNPHSVNNYVERSGVIFGNGHGTSDFNNFGARFHRVNGTTFSTISDTLVNSVRTENGGSAASISEGGVTYDVLVFINNNLVASRGIYILDQGGNRILQQTSGNDLGDIQVGETIGAGSHIRTPIVGTGPNGRHAYALLGAADPPNYDSLLLYAVGVNSDDPGMAGFTNINDQSPVNMLPVTVQHGVRDTIVPSDLGLTEFGPSNTSKEIALVYDRESQALLIFARDDAGNYKCGKWTRDGGIVAVIDVPFIPNAAAASKAYASGTFAWCSSALGTFQETTRVALIHIADFRLDDKIDGSASSELAAADWGLSSFGGSQYCIWDSRRFSLYGEIFLSSETLYRISLNSGEQAGVTLANIVEDISIDTGLQSQEDIDVEELSDTIVPGYVVADQQSARDAIQPLSDLYFFDGVESDYKLRFLDRGRSPSMTLEEDDLVVTGDDRRSYTQTRVQESEIPTSVQFTYLDNENDYQRGAQQSSRVLVPRPTVRSDNQQTIGTPVACDADTAKQAAEKTLFTRWNEREGFELRAGWEALVLDPADVILLNLNNGRQARMRLENADSGVDFSMEMRGVQEQNNQYVSTASGQTGNAIQVAPYISRPAEFFFLDTPFLRDVDDPGATLPLVYWAASVQEGYEFPGAVLYESQDLITFSAVGATNSACSWGTLSAALQPPQSAYTWDRENTILLSVGRGFDDFETKTDLEVLNGANAIALVRDNGEVEIVQFAEVEVVASNVLRLSRLLRGRRGTENFSEEEHPSGTMVILLDPSTLRTYTDALIEVNQAHSYKCVAVGRTLEGTTALTQTPKGRTLKPYSPVQLRGYLLSGDDIGLSALRRTRLGGGLMDDTGTVPLNEDSEEYALEILDTDGVTVLRTITGLTTPSYTYANADILTDFGSVPEELTVVWYQISASVGRGFPGRATLRIAA